MKRKHNSERLQNEGSRDNFADRWQHEFMPVAKKTCRALPVPPASVPTQDLYHTNTSGKKHAQLTCAPALSLAEQQTQESCNTGKEAKCQSNALLQKEDEAKKASGKRKCKTKHLEVQMRRKRSFFAMDDPFEMEDTQDMATLPNKMMKQGEPTLHHVSLPAPVCQKLHKQLQQRPSQPTI